MDAKHIWQWSVVCCVTTKKRRHCICSPWWNPLPQEEEYNVPTLVLNEVRLYMAVQWLEWLIGRTLTRTGITSSTVQKKGLSTNSYMEIAGMKALEQCINLMISSLLRICQRMQKQLLVHYWKKEAVSNAYRKDPWMHQTSNGSRTVNGWLAYRRTKE